jgi:predicted kinase
MVGLPASGKSTLAFLINEKLQMFNVNCHIIELDQLFKESDNNTLPIEGKWQMIRAQAYNKARTFMKSSHSSFIIIDDTNEYRSMRKPYFRLAQEYAMKYIEVHISIGLKESILRDSQREAEVGGDVIMNIA